MRSKSTTLNSAGIADIKYAYYDGECPFSISREMYYFLDILERLGIGTSRGKQV